MEEEVFESLGSLKIAPLGRTIQLLLLRGVVNLSSTAYKLETMLPVSVSSPDVTNNHRIAGSCGRITHFTVSNKRFDRNKHAFKGKNLEIVQNTYDLLIN